MKKNNSFTGSNGMYADHDNLVMPTVTNKKNMRLDIANCRGRKPVLNEIKKARNILQNLLIELNGNEGERAIRKCTATLWDILENNK